MKVRIMGVVNVTPDSFSDGGLYFDCDSAVKHAFSLLDDGADIIDIGGESTRPGSSRIDVTEESNRIVPVIQRIKESSNAIVSIDTMNAFTALNAINAGADIINDVYGLQDKGMMDIAKESGCSVIIGHIPSIPSELHKTELPTGSLSLISNFLKERAEDAMEHGINEKNIILDPCVGFGKSVDDNISIIKNASLFSNGFPVLIGVSRKRVLSSMYPNENVDEATVKASILAIESGASIVRVHNVKAMKNAIQSMNL